MKKQFTFIDELNIGAVIEANIKAANVECLHTLSQFKIKLWSPRRRIYIFLGVQKSKFLYPRWDKCYFYTESDNTIFWCYSYQVNNINLMAYALER